MKLLQGHTIYKIYIKWPCEIELFSGSGHRLSTLDLALIPKISA